MTKCDLVEMDNLSWCNIHQTFSCDLETLSQT